MSASRSDRADERVRNDLVRIGAHANTAEDYDEVPGVTAEQFARAVPHRDGKPARGRPPVGDR